MAQCEECEGTGEVVVTHYWNADGREMEFLDEESVVCPACCGDKEDDENGEEGDRCPESDFLTSFSA